MHASLVFFVRDLRRSWILLVAWIAIHVAWGVHAVRAEPSQFQGGLLLSLLEPLAFPVLYGAVLLLIVECVVHQDPLLGSNAFWRTRPIDRGWLLASKALYMALLASVAALVVAPAFLWLGLPAGELPEVLLGVVRSRVTPMAFVMLVAALTPGPGRYWATIVALFFCFWLVVASQTGLLGNGFRLAQPSILNLAHQHSCARVREILETLGAALVIVHQYLTLRSRRSSAMLACLAAAYLVVPYAWRQDPAVAEPPTLPAPASLPSIKIAFGGYSTNRNLLRTDPWMGLLGLIQFKGVEHGLVVEPRASYPTVTLGGGSPLEGVEPVACASASGPAVRARFSAERAAAFEDLLGGSRIFQNSYAPGDDPFCFASIGRDAFERNRNSGAHFSAGIDCVVCSFSLVAEVPVVAGSHFTLGKSRVSIDRLETGPAGIKVVLAATTVGATRSSLLSPALVLSDPREPGDRVFILVNRGRKEATAIVQNGRMTASFSTQYYLGGWVAKELVELPFEQVPGSTREPLLDGKWMAGATLACIQRVPRYEFTAHEDATFKILGEPNL